MSKPGPGTTINASLAIASGLAFSWIFAEGSGATTLESVSGVSVSVDPSKWSSDGDGPILANPGSLTLLANGSALPTAAVTVVVGYRKRDTINRSTGAFGYGFSPLHTIRFGAHLPYSDGIVYWDFGLQEGDGRLSVGGLSVGTLMTQWAFAAGPSGMQIWQNATLRASKPQHVVRESSSLAWGVGQHAAPGADQYDLAYLHLWDRMLGGAELAALNTDPYAMFRRAVRRRATRGRRALLPC